MLISQWCLTLCNPGTVTSLCPRDSPGKNTGEGCHCLLQGIFLTQKLNLGLLHRRQILYYQSYWRRLEQGKTALKNVYTISVYHGWGFIMHSWPSNFYLLSIALLIEVDGLTHTPGFFLYLSEAPFPRAPFWN